MKVIYSLTNWAQRHKPHSLGLYRFFSPLDIKIQLTSFFLRPSKLLLASSDKLRWRESITLSLEISALWRPRHPSSTRAAKMELCTNPDSSQFLAQSSHYNPQQSYFDDAASLLWPNSVVANRNVRFSTSSCPPQHHYRAPESSTASSIRKRTAYSVPTSPMPPKRTSEQSPTGTPSKLQKTDNKSEDFSNSVKKRLQSSTRTGQACDRCKVCWRQ